MNSRVRDILSLSRESGWGTGYREAAELVLDYLLDLTGGRSALILAASPIGLTSGAIRPLAWREVSADDIAPYEAGALPAIVSLTAKSGRPLLLPTEELESVLGRRKPPSGFCPSTNEALGTLPLIRRNSLLGVCLFLCPQRFAFEPESKSILEIFAGTAADCLATAQEYERSLRATRIEEAEAQRARALQQELTPSFLRSGNLVLWAHLHAAGELAGDIVMARSSSPGRMAVWAADVAGRGVSAAWSMMLLRQLLAELSPETTGPANALSMINSRLHRVESLEPSTGLFATLIGLLLDEEKQVARCARAGAPRLFHVDSQGAIKGWAPDGLALGLAPDADFEEIEIPLKPGDKLVWASDGLINAKDGAGRRWGEGGLTDSILAAASLPARALYERILSAVGEFGAVEEAQDDRSLIVIGHDIGPDWTGQASGAERGRLLEDALGFLSGGVDVGTRDFTALRLLLDEAIKNAHEHGNKLNDHAFIEVRIILSRSHVHLRVRDEGGKLNEQATGVALRNESLLEDKGRGFLLMRHHADHLWVEDDHGELNAVRLLEGPA
jgi:serine phosphatase RsbU (regulator of sigma subunit)/anti-sigma regulatory factor (Ser/Thr protein kinase)